jgi:hypothetical protein
MVRMNRFKFIFHFSLLFLLSIFLSSCICDNTHRNLDKPHIQNGIVLTFATEAAVAAYTYHYSTYQQDFLYTSQYFTPQGWNYFRAILEQSGDLNRVIKRKMIVSAIVINPPVLLGEGIYAGRYGWNIHVPLLVVYQNNKEIIKRNVMANLTVVRTPQIVGSRGLGVESFLAG